MQTRISKLNEELSSVSTQKDTFLQMKNFFESDFFAEREARLKYGMQKAGEYAVIIQEGDQKTNQTPTVLSTGSQGDGNSTPTIIRQMMINIQRWFEYFFHTS